MLDMDLRLKKMNHYPNNSSVLLHMSFLRSELTVSSRILRFFFFTFSPVNYPKNSHSENLVHKTLLHAVMENKSHIC